PAPLSFAIPRKRNVNRLELSKPRKYRRSSSVPSRLNSTIVSVSPMTLLSESRANLFAFDRNGETIFASEYNSLCSGHVNFHHSQLARLQAARFLSTVAFLRR